MKAMVVLLCAGLLALGLAASAVAKDIPGAKGKLDTQVRALVEARQHNQSVQGQAEQDRVTVKDDRVLVDVYVRGEAAAAAAKLGDAGMDVVAQTDQAPVPMVEGYLPVGRAEAAASLDVTQGISAITATGTDAVDGTDVGSVTSAGDAAHNGPAARALGVNGAGVKVGVMSDSINAVGGGVAGSQATGDLPANVQVLADNPSGSDEGRAMAEIIYDTAPGITSMAFASGGPGPAGKANHIAALKNAGAQIIADDIFYLEEPFFQDGAVAQAVDAAKAAGVTYFASAGNRARQSWEGTYLNGANDFHNFGGGDEIQSVATVPSGGFIEIVLQWDEAWGHAVTDLDTQLYDMSSTTLLTSSEDDNLSTGFPTETLVWNNNTGSSKTVGLAVHRFGGTRNPFMKWIGFGGSYNIEHGTNSDAINPDAASALGSYSVAAIDAAEPGHNDPESYSSRGPKRRLFDKNGNPLPAAQQTRQKPQLAAADCVNTTVPGFVPFCGTSAATPSAAGVAALVKQAKPSLTPDQLGAIMTNPANAIDCTLAGNPDNDCGFGFILADRAVQEAKGSPGTPTISSFTPTSGPTEKQVTINGTNLTGATAVKFNGLASQAFTVNSSTNITAKVPAGATTGKITVTTPSGTATSAGSYTVTLVIAKLSPSSGPKNTVVTVTGTGFNTGSAVKFNGVAATKTFVSSTTLQATVPASATTGRVTVTNTTGVVGTVTSANNFAVTPFVAPTVSSFTPTSGPTGTAVTVTGTHFSGASAVKVNGKAASFNVVSDTQIKLVVPPGATTGKVSVTTAAGTGTSASNFAVALSITSFSPASGPAGTTVTINGVGFTTGSVVKFNGVTASKTFVSASRLTAVVPASATTGRITVTNTAAPVGTVTSATNFTKT